MDIDALWDFFDPTASEVRFRSALNASGSSEERLEIATQLARSLGLQGKFEEAKALLDDPAFEAASPRIRARWNLEQGRVLNSSGRRAESLQPFHRAVDEAVNAGDDGLQVDALHMLGIVDDERSLEWNEQALQLSGRSSDPKAKKWRASLLNNIGWTYFGSNEFERALALFEEAYAIRHSQGEVQNIRIARWCVGRVLRALGRSEEAFAIMQELAPEDASGYAHEELAELFAQRGEQAQAASAATSALAVLGVDDYFVKYESERLERLKALAGYISE